MRGTNIRDTKRRRDAPTHVNGGADLRSSAPSVDARDRIPEGRSGRPTLAIRARYGNGELNVEARERWAIAALVVLAALGALAVIVAT